MNPHFNIQVIHSSAIFKTCFKKHLTKKSPDDLSILSIEKKNYKMICSQGRVKPLVFPQSCRRIRVTGVQGVK